MNLDIPFSAVSSRQFAEETGAHWHGVEAAHDFIPSMVTIFGDDEIIFPFENVIPAAGVLQASNLRVVTPHGWLIDSAGRTLADHSWYGMQHVDEWKRKTIKADVVELEGRVCVLASDWASNNYGHFLMDVVPRIDLIERAGFRLADMTWVLAPYKNTSFMSVLAELGVSETQCVWSDHPTCYHCPEVVAPTFPGARRTMPVWAANFLASRLSTRAESGRRLYIPRTTRRRVSNEEELITFLSTHGFEVFDPGTSSGNPRQVFAEADIVIGGGGAGLTDIIFARPGAVLLELVPTDHVYPYYLNAASARGVHFGAIVCKSFGERETGAWGPSPFDCIAEVKAVHDALQWALRLLSRT